jgi:hypothetical protein
MQTNLKFCPKGRTIRKVMGGRAKPKKNYSQKKIRKKKSSQA